MLRENSKLKEREMEEIVMVVDVAEEGGIVEAAMVAVVEEVEVGGVQTGVVEVNGIDDICKKRCTVYRMPHQTTNFQLCDSHGIYLTQSYDGFPLHSVTTRPIWFASFVASMPRKKEED
jgi:hypothetical protein